MATRTTSRKLCAWRRRRRELAPFLAAVAVCLAGARADDVGLLVKAADFRQALVERHISPEGLLLYRIQLSRWREDLAGGRYPNLADTPTFTGIWAATACTRARVESDPAEALADARNALQGLRFLMDVTGRRGLLARAVRRDAGRDTTGLSGKWLPGATGFENYVYRGDVSVDQYVNGLLPALAACRERFPRLTRDLAVDFASHLLEHDMKLVDGDGQQTRYGDLSWLSGQGFNSLFQLTGYAAFVLAAELDDDPRWAAQRDRLRDRYRVAARSRRTNLRVLGITSPSNDLMSWSLYRVLIPLARASHDPALPELRHGLHRSWLRVHRDGNPYFTAVLCHVEPESCDPAALADALSVLDRFPLDKRKIIPSPEALEAISPRLVPGRKWKRLAARRVPIELRPVSSYEWKSSPYRLQGGVLPDIEYTGLDFLAAYWLTRLLPSPAELQP
jgi:hypothetical protein